MWCACPTTSPTRSAWTATSPSMAVCRATGSRISFWAARRRSFRAVASSKISRARAGLLRPGQLAREPGGDVDRGRSLGSVFPVLRPAGPRRLFPARREITALSECAGRHAVRRRHSRSRVSRRPVGPQHLEHRPENRFRIPVDGRRQDQSSRWIRPLLHANPGQRVQPVRESWTTTDGRRRTIDVSTTASRGKTCRTI